MTRVILIAALAASAMGCGARMAAVSTEKSAYATRVGVLGTDLYHCTAETPERPVCSKVDEQ